MTASASMRATRALFRLELAEAMRSRWLAFTAAVYCLVFGGFIWFGMRESRVLGFTGLSRVVLNVANAVVIAVPLVALVATSQTVVRARQSGFFELLLSQPVRRADWFVSVVTSRLLVVVGPLVVLLLGALIFGRLGAGDDAMLAPVVARSLLVTVSLAWAFLGIGFWISSRARTPERAMVMALVAWLCAAALHDFALVGLLLRFRLAPGMVFALAAANPVEAARIAILGGVDPDLSVLGPVGFWLANKLGAGLGLAVGAGWPAALGTFAMWRAHRRLVTTDLVG
jgi:ABC-2 type transport system permease protein